MIFGACHTPPTLVAREVAKVVGARKVQVLTADDSIAHRSVYVLLGVAALRAHATSLADRRAAVVIVDSYLELSKIDDVRLLDADRVEAHEYTWAPKTLRVAPVSRAVAKHKRAAAVVLRRVDVLPKLVARVRSGSVLDKVLTLQYAVSDKEAREVIKRAVMRFLLGSGSTRAIETALKRATQAPKALAALAELTTSLHGDVGVRLRRAVAAAYPEFREDVVVAAASEHGVDPFDIRYVGTQAPSTAKIRRRVKESVGRKRRPRKSSASK